MCKISKLGTVVFCLVVVGILGLCAFAENAVKTPLNSQAEETQTFTVNAGQGVEEIGANLQRAGLISSSTVFNYFIWKSGQKSQLKAGTYELSPAMSIVEMVGLLSGNKIAGLGRDEVKISIPEGFSNAEIIARLRANGLAGEGESFDELDLSDENLVFLPSGSGKDHLQGYLFPDTYRFKRYATLAEISDLMLKNFKTRVYGPLEEEVKNSGRDFREVLILASIVEKEAAHTEEMADIAGVFQNRLQVGQRLQSDATINYVVGEGRARATSQDLEIDSPFNTYKYKGLPPTPICNPGLAAIKAALNPTQHNYYYFLTTQDAARKTYFAESYEEHLKNKTKYLK